MTSVLRCLLSFLISLGAVVFASTVAGAEKESPYCHPSADLRPVLTSIIPGDGRCEPSQDCWLEKIASVEELLDAHPDDLHVHRTYQDVVRYKFRPEEVAFQAMVDQYAQWARRRPNDPVAQYLHARLARDDDEQKGYFARAVELDPEFPWGRLGMALASLERDDEWRPIESEATARHMAAFLRLCPTVFREPLLDSFAVSDTDFWRSYLPALRAAFHAAAPEESLLNFEALWRLEFRVAAVEEHDGVRQRLSDHLAEIEKLHLESNLYWWEALAQGYEMSGEEEGLQRVQRGMMKPFPCAWRSVEAQQERWGDLYQDDSVEAARTLYRESGERIQTCPDDFGYHMARFHALSRLPELSDEEIIEEVDRYLNAWERAKNRIRMAHSPYYRVAELLLEKNLQLSRVPELLREELILVENKRERSSQRKMPQKLKDEVLLSEATIDFENTTLLAEAYLKLEKSEDTGTTLPKAKHQLELVEERAVWGSVNLAEYQARYWRLAGKLADLEDRKADALAYYRLSESLEPEPAMAEAARHIWLALGGNDESWAALLEASRHAKIGEAWRPTPWRVVDKALFDFELGDLEGESWTRARLEGKTVLINFWATWCGPCRVELPYLQELQDALAEREELDVITFNADYNLGLVAPYAEKEGFTFPILIAERFCEEQGIFSVPQSWIVDAGGRVRLVQMGFSMEKTENWVEETLRLLEETARNES